jgi:hypothetical protein
MQQDFCTYHSKQNPAPRQDFLKRDARCDEKNNLHRGTLLSSFFMLFGSSYVHFYTDILP